MKRILPILLRVIPPARFCRSCQSHIFVQVKGES